MLEKLIQRSSQRRLVIGLLLTLFLLEIAVVNARYYYNLVAGPFELASSDVIALENPDQQMRYRVTLEGDQAYDTGYEYFASEGGALVYSYAALRFGDRLLLVELNGRLRGNIPRRLTGELILILGAVQAQVLTPIFEADPGQRAVFLPYMLYARDFARSGYFGLIALVPALIFSLYLLLTGLRRALDPASYPAAQALRPYGDPLTVARQLEKDLHTVHTVIGNLHLVGDWLIYLSPSALEATRLNDLVWIYKKVTQQRANSAAAGKTNLVCIHNRYGGVMTHIAPESQANEMLQIIARRAPQAIVGNSPELQRQWRFNRAALIAAADPARSKSGSTPISAGNLPD